MSDFKANLNFVIEQYQKIQDYVIKTGLYKDKLDTQSHADLVLTRIKELELEIRGFAGGTVYRKSHEHVSKELGALRRYAKNLGGGQ